MSGKVDYTTLALRYTARFPALTYLGTQVNFWIIANLLLVAIIALQSQIFAEIYRVDVTIRIRSMIVIAVVLGVINGLTTGSLDYYLGRKFFSKQPLGKVILFKTISSLAILVLTLTLLRFVLFEPLFSPSVDLPGIVLKERSWQLLFRLLVVFYFFMTLLISFINQINRKYGPGLLIPLLLGRFRNPKEQERIFVFMDLKSSTSTAEQLGHLKYSAFIRDCFADINEVLYPFRAQVYQYVGDEIVVTWSESEGLKDHLCIAFFFACRKQFLKRAEYYRSNYGLLPAFKAGGHSGIVTAVEIGEVKRDIAYHGDTLNTAARIQSICNDYQRDFIISKPLLDKLGQDPKMNVEELGMILLKGKTQKVGLVSIEWIDET